MFQKNDVIWTTTCLKAWCEVPLEHATNMTVIWGVAPCK